MSIITVVFQQVSGALNMLNFAGNLFETAVIGAAKGAVSKVVGGCWTGEGANKFAEFVTTQFIALATTGQTNTQSTGNNINQAQQIIHEADNMANGIVNDFENLCSSIY